MKSLPKAVNPINRVVCTVHRWLKSRQKAGSFLSLKSTTLIFSLTYCKERMNAVDSSPLLNTFTLLKGLYASFFYWSTINYSRYGFSVKVRITAYCFCPQDAARWKSWALWRYRHSLSGWTGDNITRSGCGSAPITGQWNTELCCWSFSAAGPFKTQENGFDRAKGDRARCACFSASYNPLHGESQ